MKSIAKLLLLAGLAIGSSACTRYVHEDVAVQPAQPTTVTKSESSSVKTESSNSNTMGMTPDPSSSYEHKSESSRTTTIQTNP